MITSAQEALAYHTSSPALDLRASEQRRKERRRAVDHYTDQARIAQLESQRDELLKVLVNLNHMGGDDRGGYCICARSDGSAPNDRHASHCRDVRVVLSRLSEDSVKEIA